MNGKLYPYLKKKKMQNSKIKLIFLIKEKNKRFNYI